MRKRNLRNRNLRNRNLRNKEQGIALLIVLMALFLISAIGMGMIFMSNTETAVNQNYRDTQQAFFAMRGGLEEMRDRMRSNSVIPITLPAAMPSTTAGSIVYITNPSGASDSVFPTTFGNQYFDDEFCHESFVGSGVTYRAPGIVCGSSDVPPSGATSVASVMPYTNTTSSLKYKWVRVTQKQNGTFPLAPVDSGTASSPVCWDSANAKEASASALGWADCTTAQNHGLNVAPVYIVTALAITPQGSRRIGQYETAAQYLTPPPAALGLDGVGSSFNPSPNSINYVTSGINGDHPACCTPPIVPGCSPSSPVSVPAISTGDDPGRIAVVNSINGTAPAGPDRSSNYPGTAPPLPATATPSVINEGPTGGNQFGSQWSNPASLNNLVSTIANGADQTVSPCGIAGTGTPCGPPATGLGTPTTPLITFVNGDFNFPSTSGAGVLVVTGNLTITGSATFDGLILVIGQGVMSVGGGGDGKFYGAVFLAQTNSRLSTTTPPYAQLATLGSPLMQWNGGGKNGIYYNSCWADIGNHLHYMVVASREEMY